MVRISKRLVRKDVMEKIFQLFFEAVGKKSRKEDFLGVIHDVLSPTERVMVAKRVTIIFLLLKKIDYQTIADVVKVSQTTIAKFNLIMKHSTGAVNALQGMLLNHKLMDVIDKFFLTIDHPGRYGVNWRSAWKKKFEYERRKSEGL